MTLKEFFSKKISENIHQTRTEDKWSFNVSFDIPFGPDDNTESNIPAVYDQIIFYISMIDNSNNWPCLVIYRFCYGFDGKVKKHFAWVDEKGNAHVKFTQEVEKFYFDDKSLDKLLFEIIGVNN